MKQRTRKPAAARSQGPGRQRSKERRIIVLDQDPLRQEAATECRRAMVKLEKARAGWKHFEREDKPAFERWMAQTFGALLSRVRETEALAREKEALVREVELEMMLGGAPNRRVAFARVQRRRESSSPGDEARAGAPPPRWRDEDFENSEPEEMSELDQEFLFEEFLDLLGLRSDRMSETQYQKMFADFKANVLGRPPPEPPPAYPPEPIPPKPEQNRIKELYRLLVRRLHPDSRADKDAEVSVLWHEVQEAYSAGNIDRLEMLLALTDIQDNATGEHTSLFQLRSVLAELRSAFNALQRNLRAARKDRAWNFARRDDRASLETRLRRELESDLAVHEEQLRQLETLIARWTSPSKARQGQTRKRQAEFFY